MTKSNKHIKPTFQGDLTADKLDEIFGVLKDSEIAPELGKYANIYLLNNIDKIIFYARDNNISGEHLQRIAENLIVFAIKNRHDWKSCITKILGLVPEINKIDIFSNVLLSSLKADVPTNLIDERLIQNLDAKILPEVLISTIKMMNEPNDLSPDRVNYVVTTISNRGLGGMVILGDAFIDSLEDYAMKYGSEAGDNFKQSKLYEIIINTEELLDIFVVTIVNAIKMDKGLGMINMILRVAPQNIQKTKVIVHAIITALENGVDSTKIRKTLDNVPEAKELLGYFTKIYKANLTNQEMSFLLVKNIISAFPQSQTIKQENLLGHILSIAAKNRLNPEEVESVVVDFDLNTIIKGFAQAIVLVDNDDKLKNIFGAIPLKIDRVELFAYALCYKQLHQEKSTLIAKIIKRELTDIGLAEIFQKVIEKHKEGIIGEVGVVEIATDAIYNFAKNNQFDSIGHVLRQINFKRENTEKSDVISSVLADAFILLTQNKENHGISAMVKELQYVATNDDISLALAYTFWSEKNPTSVLFENVKEIAGRVFDGFVDGKTASDLSSSNLTDATNIFMKAICCILDKSDTKTEQGVDADRKCVVAFLNAFAEKTPFGTTSKLIKEVEIKLGDNPRGLESLSWCKNNISENTNPSSRVVGSTKTSQLDQNPQQQRFVLS